MPGTTTQWPSTLNMASTFDPALALEWGTAMGEEFWGKGTNIQEVRSQQSKRHGTHSAIQAYLCLSNLWQREPATSAHLPYCSVRIHPDCHVSCNRGLASTSRAS